jgi:hypothetical protein
VQGMEKRIWINGLTNQPRFDGLSRNPCVRCNLVEP